MIFRSLPKPPIHQIDTKKKGGTKTATNTEISNLIHASFLLIRRVFPHSFSQTKNCQKKPEFEI